MTTEIVSGVFEHGPAGSPPIFPITLTSRQGKLELLYTGKHDLVLAAIEAMDEPDRTAALIEWNGPFWQRNSPMVAAMAMVAGWDEAALDAHFAAALAR